MKHFLLFYELTDDYATRRVAYRADHLGMAWAAADRGELILAGAFAEKDGALLLFRGESPRVAEAFAEQDPYVLHGLVKRWRVREWTTVVGDGAADPTRPEGV